MGDCVQVILTIPKEFEDDWHKDRFADSLNRLCADAHCLAGTYEEETAHMLIDAFKNANIIESHDYKVNLLKEKFGTLCICALRYCHGRQSYMPDLVRDSIRPHLKDLTDKDLGVMIDDCDFQRKMCLYGDEKIDKPGWLQWEQELQAEKERRLDIK